MKKVHHKQKHTFQVSLAIRNARWLVYTHTNRQFPFHAAALEAELTSFLINHKVVLIWLDRNQGQARFTGVLWQIWLIRVRALSIMMWCSLPQWRGKGSSSSISFYGHLSLLPVTAGGWESDPGLLVLQSRAKTGTPLQLAIHFQSLLIKAIAYFLEPLHWVCLPQVTVHAVTVFEHLVAELALCQVFPAFESPKVLPVAISYSFSTSNPNGISDFTGCCKVLFGLYRFLKTLWQNWQGTRFHHEVTHSQFSSV